MQQVTVTLYPDPERLHPVERQLADDPALSRDAIHSVKELDDGTLALLAEVSGDLDRYEEIMERTDVVHEYAVSGDDEGYCYSRVDPTPLTRELVGSNRGEEFVVQMPIEYTDDGGQRFTMVGDAAAFENAPMALPDGVELDVESVGPYHPDTDRVFADLTDRQRDVLETALDLGYYENPRHATQADVAAELGVAPGTVGNHLRKVEARVFGKYVR